MKTQIEELEELLEASKAGGSTRAKLRREFPTWTQTEKDKFLDGLRWNIILTTNPTNYNKAVTPTNKLVWDLIDGAWEASSLARYEPLDSMTWRFRQNQDGLWIDDSSEELRIDEVRKAVFMSPVEAKSAYQKWENEMIEALVDINK